MADKKTKEKFSGEPSPEKKKKQVRVWVDGWYVLWYGFEMRI